MSEAVRAFILAAGRGERLRPISDQIPKPLVPFLGMPILEYILNDVSEIKPDGIGINLHYKGEDIERWLHNSDRWKILRRFPEDPVLGTGGALKNAEAFLSGNPFLVHNADIISDIGLSELVGFHLKSENIATLAVHDHARHNNLCIDRDGTFRMVGFGQCIPTRSLMKVAFTGIAVYSPEFLRFIPDGNSSVVEAWEKATNAGRRIGTFDVTGCFWGDIGNPKSYVSAMFERLRSEGENIYIHTKAIGCDNALLDGFVVMEKECSVGRSAFLRNCVVLPGGRAEDESRYENCIIGSGLKIDFKETDILITSNSSDNILIGTGGSDRKYFRQVKSSGPVVIMQCRKDDEDFDRHIEYSQFFRNHSVPVPELISVDKEQMTAEFEDLGDISLYSWLKCHRDLAETEKIYKKVLDIAVQIHHVASEDVSSCKLLSERIFDYDHFRWETDYFIKWFVRVLRQIKIKRALALEEEFHMLAETADSFRKTIIHRDFQSQNIMMTRANMPKLIDYQGSRMGPPAYDIVSFLWDPYVRLDDSLRENLVRYYIDKSSRISATFKASEFTETLITCRLQRHMQALGAYSYLSKVKGKGHFLKHVPEAFRQLKNDIKLTGKMYPALNDLINEINQPYFD
jgi:NDP-sugar pyrophosphorylase family protein/aminoglycoside/choline kinase family phosphotransferase